MKYQKTTLGWDNILRAKLKVNKGLLALLESEDLIGTFRGNEKYVHTKVPGTNYNINIYNPEAVVDGVEIDVVFQKEILPESEKRTPRRRVYISTEPRGIETEIKEVIRFFCNFFEVCEGSLEKALEVYKKGNENENE